MKRFILLFAVTALVSFVGSFGLGIFMTGTQEIGLPLPFMKMGSQRPFRIGPAGDARVGYLHRETEFRGAILAADAVAWSLVAWGLSTWLARRKSRRGAKAR